MAHDPSVKQNDETRDPRKGMLMLVGLIVGLILLAHFSMKLISWLL